jgi:lipopolysaccharide biosynthesis glycosyltransferase
MENADSRRRFAFFVLHSRITEESQKKLGTQVACFSNFTIDFLDVGKILTDCDFFFSNRSSNRIGITVETYYRIVIPWLFMEYDKVIYLDGDMICLDDISELYDVDISEYMISSCRDILGAYDYYLCNGDTDRYKILGIRNQDDYFIAGMIVFNNRVFRNFITLEKILDFATSRKWNHHDQDVLNVLCEGRILYLSTAWDFSPVENANCLPEHIRQEYLQGEKNPKIIHYAASRKPWNSIFYIKYFEYFWKYATRTPFMDIIVSRMEKKFRINLITYFDLKIIDDIKNNVSLSIQFLFKCLCLRIAVKGKGIFDGIFNNHSYQNRCKN